MRLFLSSIRFGNQAELLQELLGEQAKIGVIANARDYNDVAERAQGVQELLGDLTSLGFEPHEVDLRPYFGQPDMLRLELQKYAMVWVAGGNTFVLARAFEAAGAYDVIAELVRSNALIYGGESAGAIMATPSLKGVEFADDPDVVPAGYADTDVWDGMGLLPYSIVPHYQSGYEGIDRMEELLVEDGISYKTLTDSQVLLVVGEDETVLS